MIVLSIDPGMTATGWACAVDGKLIEYGHECFTPQRGESRGMLYIRFRRWLTDLMNKLYPPIECESCSPGEDAMVIVERPNQRGGPATEILMGLTTRVQEIAEELGWEYAVVPLTTLKKFATGSGRGDKEAMKYSAVHRWALGGASFPQLTEDEADALCLLWYGIEKVAGDADTHLTKAAMRR